MGNIETKTQAYSAQFCSSKDCILKSDRTIRTGGASTKEGEMGNLLLIDWQICKRKPW